MGDVAIAMGEAPRHLSVGVAPILEKLVRMSGKFGGVAGVFAGACICELIQTNFQFNEQELHVHAVITRHTRGLEF